MSRPRAIQWLVPVLLAFTSGCGSPVVSIDDGQRDFEPTDYPEVLERWSRDVHIIPVDGVENVLTATATHLSFEFRWAYVVRRAHDLRLSPGERQALHEQEFGGLEQGHEFFVSATSGVDGGDQLEPDEGPWEIRLVDDKGRQVAPLGIEELRKPTVAEARYFEFDPVHRRAYRVVFPLAADDGTPILSSATRYYSLRFSSPLGRSEATWNTASNVD